MPSRILTDADGDQIAGRLDALAARVARLETPFPPPTPPPDPPAPVDAVVGEWEPWSEWTLWVRQGDIELRARSRVRRELSPAQHGGVSFPLTDFEREERPYVPTPVDAVLGDWGAWEPLTPWILNPADPTQEMRTLWRSRPIVTPASAGGWEPSTDDLEDTQIETRPVIVSPPSQQHPFEWHNMIRQRPEYVRGWMMRDEAEVQGRVRRKQTVPRHTHYVWPEDPFEDAQDAAQVIIPGSRSLPPLADGTPAASHSNYEQSIYPVNIGANVLNRDLVRAVVSFEFYNDKSWFTEGATCEKSFNCMRHPEVIAFEMRQRFRHRGGPPTPKGGPPNQPMPEDGLAWFDVRSYGHVLPPHYVPSAPAPPEKLAELGLEPPVWIEPRGNSDAIHPMMNWDFWQRWNIWNRAIAWMDFRRDDFYATCSIVVGDENRDAVYLVKEARCPWPQRDRVTPGGMFHTFLHEWNSSQNRSLERGDMIAYLGPVHVLMDVEDPLSLWQRPLRRGR
jgi:hypothetical protein